jgi:hypothetical protein
MKSKRTVKPAVRANSIKNAKRVVRRDRTALAVRYLFDSWGSWVAFRIGKYLFKEGNWVGWLPWDDADVVSVSGDYLGTIFPDNRFYRRFHQLHRRRPRHPANPGYPGYPGYPGFAGIHCSH